MALVLDAIFCASSSICRVRIVIVKVSCLEECLMCIFFFFIEDLETGYLVVHKIWNLQSPGGDKISMFSAMNGKG